MTEPRFEEILERAVDLSDDDQHEKQKLKIKHKLRKIEKR